VSAVGSGIGAGVEYRRKRPVMMSADVVRFAALASVPAAAGFGVLTFGQLCVVGVVQTAGAIAFGAASGAHLKALVPPDRRMAANSRPETTSWIAQTAGPPLGGLLISVAGATVTMAVDAVHLCSSWTACAFLQRHAVRRTGHDDLGAPGGLHAAGSRLAPSLTRRFGPRRVLLASGLLRAPWMLLIPLAPPGTGGLVLIVTAETGLLVAAGVFNPSFGTYRMEATDDGYMARVATSWSISSKVAQPLFIALGGALTAVMSIQAVLAIGGTVCLASSLFLPWGQRAGPAPGAPDRKPMLTGVPAS
jgi:MFS family permease